MLKDEVKDLMTRLEQAIREEIREKLEEMKTHETDFRDNDYTRGLEAGKNYCIEDILLTLK